MDDIGIHVMKAAGSLGQHFHFEFDGPNAGYTTLEEGYGGCMIDMTKIEDFEFYSESELEKQGVTINHKGSDNNMPLLLSIIFTYNIVGYKRGMFITDQIGKVWFEHAMKPFRK